MTEAVVVPPFHEFIEPIMDALREAAHPMSIEALNRNVAKRASLSQEVLAVSHGDSDQPEAYYRMAWARTYLKKAGLADNPTRGHWALTERGRRDQIQAEEVLRQVRGGIEPSAPSPGLPEYLAEELLERYRTALSEGVLPAGESLDACYRRFQERFGSEVLARLDGTELLTAMHGRQGSRDSLVYWLEFKNDHEFPSTFGSIAGGSALKFGLYQSAESGDWMTGSPVAQRRLTVEEAVELAAAQRDQLVAVARHLGELARDPEAVDYDALQAKIEELAPDLHDKSWAHKYFSLNAPTILDDYHALEYQKYHLIKLQQIPNDGRYQNARLFVSIARQLGMPVTHLASILNIRDGSPRPTWRIEAGSQADWEAMRDGGFFALEGAELGSQAELEPTRDGKTKLRSLVANRKREEPGIVRALADSLFRFATGVSQGDTVVAAIGTSVVGVGTCSGDYSFQEEGGPFAHRRPIDWTPVGEFELPKRTGGKTRFAQLKHPEDLVAIERQLARPDSGPGGQASVRVGAGTPTGKGTAPEALSGVMARIDEALRRKGQVILYGPPGTGKTFWADRTIFELAARSWFGVAAFGMAEGQREDLLREGAIDRCAFHPAYGYEDFLAGYRPVLRDGSLVYEMREGIFARLCRRAQAHPQRSFYLLVDEINRGDIPRIFGELITCLEKDKRGTPLSVPLRDEPFVVPANVFLIGTMNTADRSVALLDAALRRRFAFIELMPDPALLDAASVGGLPLGAWLGEVNARVLRHVGRDARNLQIGHSYLMRTGEPVRSVDRFASVLRDDIIPLLQEYCYEDFGALERILGRGLVLAARQEINQDLFKPSNRARLIEVLLNEFAEITATPDAARAEETPIGEDADDLEDDSDEGVAS